MHAFWFAVGVVSEFAEGSEREEVRERGGSRSIVYVLLLHFVSNVLTPVSNVFGLAVLSHFVVIQPLVHLIIRPRPKVLPTYS